MSIQNHGQVQPIVVRPRGDHYEVAAGWRRVLGCQIVGIREILYVVRDLTDEQMAAYSMVENLQRRNLNPVEEARGFLTLHTKFGWTQEGIAKELGRGLTRDIVAQRLRLLTFPAKLQKLVSHDTITATHAEALARLTDKPFLLKEAIHKVVEGKLTTKQTEQLLEELTGTIPVRESIYKYLTSPEYLLLLRYLLINCYMKSEEGQYCPSCFGSVVYDESDGMQRMICKDCGWSLDVVNDPICGLLNQIQRIPHKGSTPNGTSLSKAES